MGTTPCLPDFILAATLESVFRIAPEEWEEKISKWDGGRWERLRKHCATLLNDDK